MKKYLLDTEHVRVRLDKEFHGFFVEWLSTPSELEFKRYSQEILDCYKQHGGFWLNNTSNLSAFSKELEVWMNETWMPELLETGIEFIATIIPQERYLKLKNTDPIQPFPNYPLTTGYFYDHRDARNWLRQISLAALSA